MKKIPKILLALFIAGILAANLALIPTSSALAMPKMQDDIDDALSNAYAAEQTWLDKQQSAIAKADQAVTKIQEVIDTAISHGLDVTTLQDALSTFNSAMSSVQTDHQNAAGILSGHDGFDDSGVVIDRETARQTVMDARRALGEAHMTMTQAFWALRDAVSAWTDATFPER